MLKAIFLLSLLASSFAESSLFLRPGDLNIEHDDDKLALKLSQSANILESIVWPQKEALLLSLENILRQSKDGLSPVCHRSLTFSVNEAKAGKMWAYKMLDASSKFSSGFLSNKYIDYGDYRQCLGIEAAKDGPKFVGKYCLFRIHLPLPPFDKTAPHKLNLSDTPLEGTWFVSLSQVHKIFYFETINNAVCFPSTCSSAEIQNLMQKYIVTNPLKVTFWSECDTKKTVDKSFWSHSFHTQISSVFVVFWTLGVLLLNIMTYLRPQNTPDFFRHFCFSTIKRKLLRESSEADLGLAAINCVKVIFILISIPMHSVFMAMIDMNPAGSMNGLERFTHYKDSLFSAVVSNIDMMISGFVTLSGFLTYYLIHKELSQTGGKLKFSHFVILKVMRTFPYILGCSMIMGFLLVLPLSGPLATHYIANREHLCGRTALQDFTFTANFLDTRDPCHSMMWFMATDMQLYLSSFLVIPLLYKHPKPGLLVISIICIGAIVGNISYFYNSDVTVFSDLTDIDINTFMDELHLWFYPFTHIVSFYCGIVGGWLIATNVIITDEKKIMFGWICHCLYPLVYFSYFILRVRGDQDPSRLELSVFGALRKPSWALAGLWACYAVFIKRGGIYTAMGQSRPIVLASRLFGSINMMHHLIIAFFMANAMSPVNFDTIPLMSQFVTLWVTTIACAVGFHFIYEAPAGNLVNHLISSMKNPKSGKQGADKAQNIDPLHKKSA